MRRAINLIHPSSSRTIVTKRKGQRFSLISLAEYQATVASQVIRNLQRQSASSDQVLGLHLVCAECDGFVVSNGVVRNCRHQRDSLSSMSEKSRKIGQKNAHESGAQTVGDQWVRPKVRKPLSTFSRLGRGVNDLVGTANLNSDESTTSSTSVSSKPPRPTTIAADGFSGLVLHTGVAARDNGLRPKYETQISTSLDKDMIADAEESADIDTTDQPQCNSDTLMQDWKEASERWKRSVSNIAAIDISDLVAGAGNAATEYRSHRSNETRVNLNLEEDTITETKIPVDSDRIDQPHRDHEALMHDWKEWSERWGRSVRSR